MVFNDMQLFYAPDITLPLHTLTEEESKHCVRVLRMESGDGLMITDGRGNMYTARVADANPKRCTVEIVGTETEYGKRGYSLTMAVAPTKNTDRYEWFLEKATEVGCDRFVPIECAHSERRVLKHERSEKVITSAVKQSLKAYHPILEPVTDVKEIILRPFDGLKLIAHCRGDIGERTPIKNILRQGGGTLILIGPEGDFSREEVELALANGFTPVSLGDARLRTETAALAAVMFTSFANL